MAEKVKARYIRQPLFYKDFHCTGSECPVNCCFGWDIIGWSRDEFEKIKNTDMSEELRKRFVSSFEPVTNEDFGKIFDYKIEFGANGKCPMLTENGLCMLQKELGEEYLSSTCLTYPRRAQRCGDVFIRTCQSSCLHVLELICRNENSMELENVLNKGKQKADVYDEFTVSDKINYPAVKYNPELFGFFYDVFSDKSHSIEVSIVLAAMAAAKIDEYVHRRQADRIPEIIVTLKQQLDNPMQIERLEKAKSNLSLKGTFSAGLLMLLKGTDFYVNVFENGNVSEEKWNEGMEKWNAAFGDRPYVWRNIALNLFISQRMPFRDKEYSLFENICYLAAEMSVAKFLAAAVPIQFGENTEKAFYVSTAYIDRSFTHDNVNVKKVIEYMKAFGITSPAYLMGILR